MHFLPDSLLLVAVLLLSIGLVFAVGAVLALRRRRLFRSIGTSALAALLLLSSASIVLLGFAVQGYRAFTREDLAATVVTTPTGPDRFEARFLFPDGRSEQYQLEGDQLYVDARILKWKPIANFFGMHTAYTLDRVAGRYVDLGDERSRPRTVFSLARTGDVDLFDLRQRYAFLAPVLDAEYGSATYIAAHQRSRFELRVSNTGLLIRKVADR